MPHASLSPVDRLLVEFDKSLRNLTNIPTATDKTREAEAFLSKSDSKLSAQLMRVNHAGEVAAQALYHGQSLTAKLPEVQAAMDAAAEEEKTHLAWCAQRLGELGGRRSLLDPLWYAGSFAIGAATGLVGDRWSLGFIAETERQVVEHLNRHLEKLPANDSKSRAILEQMKTDEQRHGDAAVRSGGAELPAPVKGMMGLVSKIMTRTARWF